MSDRDVDAEFADIIARWDEVESLPETPGGSATESADATSDAPAAEPAAEPSAHPSADGPAPRAAGVNPPLLPSVNPPPTRPFVVWRGAVEPDPAEAEESPDPVELRDLHDLDDDHFEPGPTAPLPPQEDLQFWGIIVGLVAGPLVLLWLVLFRPDVSNWWAIGALGLTVMGFVLLVLRQPHARNEDDPDNGARV
jgi:hypothetical protein